MFSIRFSLFVFEAGSVCEPESLLTATECYRFPCLCPLTGRVLQHLKDVQFVMGSECWSLCLYNKLS